MIDDRPALAVRPIKYRLLHMIWSSLARNRSLSPVVARCLGRIATLRCAANHGWTPRRIAKNEIARFRHLMTSHLAIPNPLPVPKPIPDQLPTSSSRATGYDPSPEPRTLAERVEARRPGKSEALPHWRLSVPAPWSSFSSLMPRLLSRCWPCLVAGGEATVQSVRWWCLHGVQSVCNSVLRSVIADRHICGSFCYGS